MFKKATVCKLADVKQIEGLEETLDRAKFLPVATNELKSSGWGVVREGELFMRSHGHILLHFMIEKKALPGSAIRANLEQRVKEFNDTHGHMPGNKVRKELRERVVDEMIPRAIPSRSVTGVWIDTKRGMVVMDTTVAGTIDLIMTTLIRASGVDLTNLLTWPGKHMTAWLMDDGGSADSEPVGMVCLPEDDDGSSILLPNGYTIDDNVIMEYPGERGTKVVFKKADLGTDAVKVHAINGAMVTEMAMTYNDRISFTLTIPTQLKGLKLLDVVKDNQVERDVDVFENNFILMAYELGALIDSLIANT